jgi:hypothetical protein
MPKRVAEMTPVEIDTVLAELWAKADAAWAKAAACRAAIERNEDPTRLRWKWAPEKLARMIAKDKKAEAEAREAAEAAVPYETEYVDRGRWKRYFLVVSSDGHVHRERNCVTCFPRTEYAWIVELADCDEEAMVLKYGEMACTICFPNAPAMKGWGSSYKAREKADRKREREAKAAAKRAATVPVPEINRTFGTDRSAEIEAVYRFCEAIHRDGLFERDPAGYSHCRELAAEDRAAARAICKALGKKRETSGEVVEGFLEARVKAKLKRDGR